MSEYGYVRVLSIDQNEERQMVEMRKLGIAEERIYKDKQSGKDFNRPMYQKLLRKLKKGDVLHILSIDRLERNYEDKFNVEWRYYFCEKKNRAREAINARKEPDNSSPSCSLPFGGLHKMGDELFRSILLSQLVIRVSVNRSLCSYKNLSIFNFIVYFYIYPRLLKSVYRFLRIYCF